MAAERESDKPDRQRSLLTAILENWNRINYWSGTVVIEDEETDNAGKTSHTSNTIEFFFDRHNRQIRLKSKLIPRSEGHSPPSRRSVTSSNRMVKHCAHYRLIDQGVLIEELRPLQAPLASQEFDLVYLLTAGADDMASLFCRVGGKFQLLNEWQSNKTILDGPNRLMLRDGKATATLTVDTSRDGALESLERKTTEGTEVWQFKYQQFGPVWLPTEIDINVKHAAVEKSLRRVLKFQQSVVNQQLDLSEFTLAKLGAHSGDLIRDTRANVQYVFNALNEPEAQSEDGLSIPVNDDNWWLIAVLNVAGWIAVLGIYAAWARNKSRHDLKPPA